MDFLWTHLNPETLADPTRVAVPIFALSVLIELTYIAVAKRGGEYETRDALSSIVMGMGNTISGVLIGGISAACLLLAYEFRLFTIQTTVLTVAIAFLIDDFRYYWSHRFAHRVRWFWADHVVHHSSQHFNLSTALRQPWFYPSTGLFLMRVPLALAGIHPGVIAFIGSLNLVYQFFIHTETVKKLPAWIEAIFNTPSHHRVHHGTNPKYIDMNYAGTLIIWDRLFGTFVPEDQEDPVKFGIVKNIGTFNPLRIATHEYVDIFKDATQAGLKPLERTAYIFAPPGWSHDGSRKTSKDLKIEAGVEGWAPTSTGASKSPLYQE